MLKFDNSIFVLSCIEYCTAATQRLRNSSERYSIGNEFLEFGFFFFFFFIFHGRVCGNVPVQIDTSQRRRKLSSFSASRKAHKVSYSQCTGYAGSRVIFKLENFIYKAGLFAGDELRKAQRMGFHFREELLFSTWLRSHSEIHKKKASPEQQSMP